MRALPSQSPSLTSVATEAGNARALEKKITTAFGFGFAVLVLIALWTSLNARNWVDTFRWVNHSHEVLETIEGINAKFEAADSAQRAYIITGAERERDAREAALAKTREQVRELAELVRDNSKQLTHIRELERKVEARVEIMREMEALRESQGFDAARQLFLTRKPEQAGAAIRAALRALVLEERELLRGRREEVDGSANRLVSTFSIFLALVFSAFFAFAVGIRRQLKERDAAQQALEDAHTALKAHAREVEDLYNNAACGYHSVDADGVLVKVNDTELDWLGYQREELIGLVKLADLLTPESRKIHQQNFPLFKQGLALRDLEVEFVRKNQTTFPALISGTVLRDQDGNYLMSRSTVFDITERKRAEEKLREQLRFTQELVEALPHPLYLKDTAGRYLGFNRAWEDFYGTTREQWIGKTAHDRFSKEVADRQEQNDRFLFQTRQPQSYEVNIAAGGGVVKDVLHKKSIFTREDGVVLGMIGVLTDITERKRAERTLQETNLFLDSMIDNIPSMIFVKDAKELRFVRLNKAGEDLIGHKRDEFIGKNDYDLFPKEQADFFTTKDREVLAAGKLLDIAEEPIQTGSGTRWLHTKKIPIHDLGSVPQFLLGISEDITERMAAQREIETLNTNLREHADRLELINRELESFSYSVSHDLRSPLRAVDGFARLLEEEHGDKLDAEGRRLLTVVRENSQRMGQLIDDLLTFARIGRKPFTSTEIDMRMLAASVFQEVKQDLDMSKAELRLDELPLTRGDAPLLRQVWVNLLANALKFSRDRPAIVIEVGGHADAEESVYSVNDNGVGFDMRYYDKLFGVFQRLHRADEFPGTGVGLAIVHRIVTRHGGRVWAEGRVDVGATFYFTLPRGLKHAGQ